MPHAYSVTFKTHFLFQCSWQLIIITVKMAPRGSSVCFFPFSFSWPSTIHYSDATKMEKKKRTQGHISSIAVVCRIYFFLKTPWHFCYRAFFPVSCSQSVSVCVCTHKSYKVCVCVWTSAPLAWYLLCASVMYNLVNWCSGLVYQWINKLIYSVGYGLCQEVYVIVLWTTFMVFFVSARYISSHRMQLIFSDILMNTFL